MKQIITTILVCLICQSAFTQKGSLTLQEMLALSSSSAVSAANQIVKDHGFEIRKQEIPEGNSKELSDSAFYFIWLSDDGNSNNRIFLDSKRKGEVITNLISYTSTDSLWYAGIHASLTANEFKLSDIQIKSDDAHDAQVYEKGNYRISIFWSYMGGEIKYYLVDVNWFSE